MCTTIPGKRVAIAIAVVGLLAVAGRTRAETLLRWKFKPGDVLRYAATQETTQTFVTGEKARRLTFTTTIAAEYIWKVIAVDEAGAATIDHSIDRVQMRLQGPQGAPMEYDSASDKTLEGAAKMVAPVFSAVVKKPFVLKITARGDVVETRFPRGLMEALVKGPPVDQVVDLLGVEGLKKFAVMVVLPVNPVAIGQSWTHVVDVKLPMPGTLGVKYTCHYVGARHREGLELQEIGVAMRLRPGKGPSDDLIKIKQFEVDGTIYFDNARGRLAEAAMNLKTQTEINMNFGIEMPTAPSPTLQVGGTMRIKLKPAEGIPPRPETSKPTQRER
jgi:hypothetical protein